MQLEYVLVGYSWTKSVEQDSYKSQHGMVTVWSNSVRSGRHQAQGKSQVLFTRPYSSEFQVLSNTRHQEKKYNWYWTATSTSRVLVLLPGTKCGEALVTVQCNWRQALLQVLFLGTGRVLALVQGITHSTRTSVMQQQAQGRWRAIEQTDRKHQLHLGASVHCSEFHLNFASY